MSVHQISAKQKHHWLPAVIPALLCLLLAACCLTALADPYDPMPGIDVNSANFPDPVLRDYISRFVDYDHNGKLDFMEIEYCTKLELPSGVKDRTGIGLLTNVKEITQNTAIDRTLFPDDALRRYVAEDCDLNKDGELSAEEIQWCTYLCLPEEVRSLAGAEVFSNLAEIMCYGCRIAEVDLSPFPHLQRASIGGDDLIAVDISKNDELVEIQCANCPDLKTLKMSRSKALKVIDFQNFESAAVEFVFSDYPVLEELCVSGKVLKSLDVTRNPRLKVLNVSGAKICSPDNKPNPHFGKLDLSNNPDLELLYIDYCGVEALDLSHNLKLRILHCEGNEIPALDLRDHKQLEWIMARDNYTLTSLLLGEHPRLKKILAEDTALNDIDVTGCPALEELRIRNLLSSSLDLSRNPELRYLDLQACDFLKELDVSNNPKLEELTLYWNSSLEKLDVTHNPDLKSLNCAKTLLTHLDLSHNPELNEIRLGEAQFACLDFSACNETPNVYGNDACKNLSGNVHPVHAPDGTFDLSTLPGFDVNRASGWSGGTVSGSVLTFRGNQVSYTYDCGKGISAVFTLTKDYTWKADEVVSEVIKAGMSDRAKAKALHDWIITHAHYSLKYSDASGILLYGEGLCDSYTKAYQMLMNKAGITAQRITGYAGGESHAWNRILIDNIWYYVDCTWDDPMSTFEDPEISGMERHDYFMVSVQRIAQDHAPDELITDPCGWLDAGNGMAFLDANGSRVTGWLEIDGGKFWLDKSGVSVIGEREIDGETFTFERTLVYRDEYGNPHYAGRLVGSDSEGIAGDVNGDEIVDGRDAVRLMKYLADEIDPDTGIVYWIDEKAADLNKDGKVDELDLLRLVKNLGGEAG